MFQLPNDALSLPQHPNIRSILFLSDTEERNVDQENAADMDIDAISFKTTIAVGTKEGIIRLYEPGKNKNRHIAEWPVVPKSQGSIRTMTYCSQEKIVLVGDTTHTLYAVERVTGRVLYQYKDINGSITSTLIIPGNATSTPEPPEDGSQKPLVLASSLDRLIYLFDLGEIRGKQRTKGKMLYSYFTGLDSVTAMAMLKKPVYESNPDDEQFWGNLDIVGENEDDKESDTEELYEKSAKRHRT